jgi:hypothetical protein
MAESKQQTYRFDDETIRIIDYLAPRLETSKAGVIRDAVRAIAWFIRVAVKQEIDDVKQLIERYGEDARITIWVTEPEGDVDFSVDSVSVSDLPVGHLLIDGVEPDDVRAVGIVEPEAKRVHMFLAMPGWQTENLGVANLGAHVLMTSPKFPLGVLPWPPDPKLTVGARLGDLIPKESLEDAPEDVTAGSRSAVTGGTA